MNPHEQSCHNPQCRSRGIVGGGNIRVHCRKEQRYRCRTCGKTFAATKGTPLYRLRTDAGALTCVLILLSNGCPVQAIVAAFGFDERTVAAWLRRSGQHCRKVHEHLVEQGQVDVQHCQADELWVKLVGLRVWMAMAMATPSRLWLGGCVSPRRDLNLITRLVERVRAAARHPAILVCVDGLSSYVTAFGNVFRRPIHTGRRGRPRWVEEEGLMLAQMIKRRLRRCVVSVERRVVRGTAEAVAQVLAATRTGIRIHTDYIERLNATFRGSLAMLARRSRAIARTEGAVEAGMWLVGCAYNVCWTHRSLRERAPVGSPRKWGKQTPAMAAGLTDHVWTMLELLRFHVPQPLWVDKRKRGRPPK